MRQALNENPKVQAGVVVVLLLVGVFMFMKMNSGGGSEAPSDAAVLNEAGTAGTGPGSTGSTPATTGATTATAAAPTDPAAAAAGATAVAIPSAPASVTGSVPAEALVPGPGLPADVIQSYARGNAIVLLLVKQGATDDELVEQSVKRISRPGVSVYVAPASKIARYARITQGLGVNRVPALIVVRPRDVSGDSPQATVSYGFRDLDSVLQAVEDGLYRGRDDVPYYPG